jgi:hypothetical protein
MAPRTTEPGRRCRGCTTGLWVLALGLGQRLTGLGRRFQGLGLALANELKGLHHAAYSGNPRSDFRRARRLPLGDEAHQIDHR